MADDSSREERIRQLAYRIWEEEGRPEGRDAEHWQMARQRVAEEEDRGSALQENTQGKSSRAGRGHRRAADVSPSRPASLSGPAPVDEVPAPPGGSEPQSDIEEPGTDIEIPKKPRGGTPRRKSGGT